MVVFLDGEEQCENSMRAGRAKTRKQSITRIKMFIQTYVSFMLVAATVLALFPSSISVIISS